MMGSQRHSMDVPPSVPGRSLTSVLLVSALVLPALTLDSLLCSFCPLQPKGKSCSNVTSQCLPSQRCSSSRGRYGSVHILSAQGCVDAGLCGSHEMVSYRGVEYNVSHTCCCRDRCNSAPKPDTSLKKLLGIIEAQPEDQTITEAAEEEPWSSCADY
ncbi:protein Bouncer-like [Nematolebias whitei]|uniref:protein Bouncer-like n=1 Tax=Nematolebias whitei TaxID=451745 RepID=UPI00189AA748|nr:protein Bouncer-like [Nematolebias whitei]